MAHQNQGKRWREHIKRYTPKTPREVADEACRALSKHALVVGSPNPRPWTGGIHPLDELAILAKMADKALDACDHGLKVEEVAPTRHRPIPREWFGDPDTYHTNEFNCRCPECR